jgi:putative OPT family oligopeptide transporter
VTETQTSLTASTGGSGSFVPPRGELTGQAIIAAVIVSAIMGASYPYMVMKLGFGPNVSVVAAFFGFIILNVIGRKKYDRWQNNIVQTAGTSAAQTAFMCVLLGAFDMLKDQTKDTAHPFIVSISPFQSFIWLTVAGTLGVLLAVPLRRHFIIDENLPFADGVAAAETLVVLDPPKSGSSQADYAEAWAKARSAAKALGLGCLLSGLLMVFREDAKLFHTIPEGWDPGKWSYAVAGVGIVTLANMGVGLSYSLLSIGSGMLIGLRINISMMLGGLLSWVILPYFLLHHGIVRGGDDGQVAKTQVLYWVMWPATGMLVAGGLAALGMRWRLLIDTFRSLKGAKISSTEFPMTWVVGGVAGLSVLLCVVQYVMLDMSPLYTVGAIILSIPLMLVGLRVLGETNWGPISALSNMMQGVFALVAPGNVAANMTASGVTGTIATSSEAIMQDFKAGHMIGSTPRAMTLAQLLAVPVGAAAVAWTYPALVKTYGLTGPNAQLSSPISRKWAGFAQLLQDGFSKIAPSALWALVIFAVLGIVFTVLEAQPKLKKWVPSPTGIGIGMLVPFSVIATMFVGGVAGTIWEKTNKRSSDQYMIPLASGLIAGEAIIAVIVPVLLWMGLGAK